MADKAEVKNEALPDLDDLLQCPVCYEIPSGQIFQCNQGHHVCGQCKARLNECPVCRALFFGTRNYAMEELIANVRKLRAFKLGGKITTGTTAESSCNKVAPVESTSGESENNNIAEDNNADSSSQTSVRAPQACKGLFRCLCCKTSTGERLPAARLLNHLRYFHSPELIEGNSDNAEYLQAWQFPTNPGRLVTAVRVSDMGIFFLIIEIDHHSLSAWLSMASAPWVAHEFSYTVTISGVDREAIFSDVVWSVRSCEGTLKKRGHCLAVSGADARALTAPTAISVKLSIRRTPSDQLLLQTQPRAVLRVASRGGAAARDPEQPLPDLEPFLLDLQNDVARLSRAFATLGREANALARSEAEMRSRIENGPNQLAPETDAEPIRPVTQPPRLAPLAQPPRPAPLAQPPRPVPAAQPQRPASAGPQPPRPPLRLASAQPPRAAPPAPVPPPPPTSDVSQMSRSARRRMRNRLRAALNANQAPVEASPPVYHIGLITVHEPPVPPPAALISAQEPPTGPYPHSASGPSNGHVHNGNNVRSNKKKHRQRR